MKIEQPYEARMRKERQALNYRLRKKATHHLSFEKMWLTNLDNL
jgi:hypothetical protein